MNLAETAEKYRKYKVVLILFAIFLLGFSIRYLARGPRIGPELDTWYHYRIVNYILDQGYIPIRSGFIDKLAYYPTGRPVSEMDLLGLPTFIAYTYKIVGITGITLMDYMVAFPAIFTSLAAIPLYLLTKEILNKKAGLLAALFWQIIPSTLTRTHAGFVDKETLASIYIFLWLWLLIKSIRTVDISKRKTLLTPILSGIFMGFTGWTWGGNTYFILVISTSALLYAIFNYRKISESFGFSLALMTLTGALTMYIVQAPRFPLNIFLFGMREASLTLVSLLYLIPIIYSRLTLKMSKQQSKATLISAITLFLLGAILTGYLQVFSNGIVGFFRGKIFLKKSLVGSTVSENLSPSFFCGEGSPIAQIMRCDWYSHFNVVLFVAPLGAILLYKRYREKKDFGSLFLLMFAVSGILGMRSDIRLSFVLTPSLAMLSAYAISHYISNVQSKEIELKETLARSKKHKVRYKAESQLSNTKITKILIVIILIGIIASPTIASFSMLNGRVVDVPQPWYKAMIWINDNTPEDAVIISWWDYGYWEQALGNRRTVVDGGNSGPLVYDTEYTEGLEYRGSEVHRDVDMAKMFTSSENEALKYLRPYVDYEKVPTYVIVSYEEFGKSGAINHISQDGGLYIFPQGFEKSGDSEADSKTIMDFIINNGIEAYTVLDFGSSWQMWFTGFDPNKGAPDPEMKNKLLAKLLPFQNTGFGQGLKHFEPVYKDEWNYVFIYKII